MERKGRVEWIDFARGIVMLMVIWGHLDVEDFSFFRWTNPLKLPGFFAISGYFFCTKIENIRTFIKKKFHSLIIPYIFLGGLSIVSSYALKLIRGECITYELLLSFIEGKEFWFIPCLFVAYIYLALISKASDNNILKFVLISILLFVAGCFCTEEGNIRIWRWDTALVAQFIITLGYLYRTKMEELLKRLFHKEICIWLISCISYISVICLAGILIPDFHMDMNLNEYSDYILCFIAIFTGIVLLFVTSKIIYKKKNIISEYISYVGKNTLCFFILSFKCMNVTKQGVSYIISKMCFSIDNWLYYLVCFVLICIELTLISAIINRYFPWMVAKERNANK